ncbi:hypothetical protein PV11_07379 [Exophiala sideris]|uniref:Uncharacterized protein n=1 Tax=Exophiala sideris TaxID=1016849 RepID=A0A0D1YYF2_9EURO|nr:hypothetical protein PV11_07379 [Exophiala sideris]
MGKYALVLLALASLASLGAAAPRHVSGPGGFAPTPIGPPRESRYRSSTSAEPNTVTYIDPDYRTYSSNGSSVMHTETHGTVTYYPTNVTWVRPTISASYSTTAAVRSTTSKSCSTTVTEDFACWSPDCVPNPGTCTEIARRKTTHSVTRVPSTTSESCSTTVTRDWDCLSFDCVQEPAVSGVCTEGPNGWKRTLSHVTVKPTTTTTTTSGGDIDGGHGTSTESSTATMITDSASPPPFLSKTSLASLDPPSTLLTSTSSAEAEVSTLPCRGDSAGSAREDRAKRYRKSRAAGDSAVQEAICDRSLLWLSLDLWESCANLAYGVVGGDEDAIGWDMLPQKAICALGPRGDRHCKYGCGLAWVSIRHVYNVRYTAETA